MKIVNHILHNGSKAATSQVLKKGKRKLMQHFMSNDKFERIVIPIMLLITFLVKRVDRAKKENEIPINNPKNENTKLAGKTHPC